MELFGVNVEGRIRTDSTRRGVGRARHLETRALWLRDVIDDARLGMEKVPGETNVSYIGTKARERERHANLVKQMAMRKMSHVTAVNQIVNFESGGLAIGSTSQHGSVLGALDLPFCRCGRRPTTRWF